MSFFLCIFTLPKSISVCLYLYMHGSVFYLYYLKKNNISNFVKFFFLFSKCTKRQFACLILNIINGKELLITNYLSLYPCLIKYCPTSVYCAFLRCLNKFLSVCIYACIFFLFLFLNTHYELKSTVHIHFKV